MLVLVNVNAWSYDKSGDFIEPRWMRESFESTPHVGLIEAKSELVALPRLGE